MPLEVPAPRPGIDRRSGLTPRALPPRNKTLFILSGFLIDVEGERFPVSSPRKGDATRADELSSRITLGVAAADVPRLTELVGKRAHLFERDGRDLLAFRIERVDPRFALLIADPGPLRG